MGTITLPGSGETVATKIVAGDDCQVVVATRQPFEVTATAMARPADTTVYTSGDAIANSATAGSVTPIAFACADISAQPFRIERLLLRTTDTGLAASRTVRAYVYKGSAAPTAASGDNAAMTVPAPSDLIGTLTGTFIAASGGGYADLRPETGPDILAFPTAQTVWVLLQSIDGFTPSANSTTITGTMQGVQERLGT